MTEVVHTLTGMKKADSNDIGARYYRKEEVDAKMKVDIEFVSCSYTDIVDMGEYFFLYLPMTKEQRKTLNLEIIDPCVRVRVDKEKKRIGEGERRRTKDGFFST